MINLSNEDQAINNNDRIAQMILAKTERAHLQIVDKIAETKRGAGGFGHTGKQ